MKVDLEWQRTLRRIRRGGGRTLTGSKIQEINIDSEGMELTPSSESKDVLVTESEADEEVLDDLLYRMVCSVPCCNGADGVCVAWVYDDNCSGEPSFPPFRTRREREADAALAAKLQEDTCDEECPSRNIPGAFID